MTPSGHRKTKRTINAIGHAHELTFSCHDRRPLLSKDRTRHWLVQSIEQARHRWNFALWAWVILPEHVHLLIRPRDHEYNMAPILKAIKQPVAQKAMAYLKEHAPEAAEQFRVTRPGGKVEHRFWQQGGGYDRNVFDPEYARTAIEYFHANPVRRQLVSSPLDWVWSSARWYAGDVNAILKIDPLDL